MPWLDLLLDVRAPLYSALLKLPQHFFKRSCEYLLWNLLAMFHQVYPYVKSHCFDVDLKGHFGLLEIQEGVAAEGCFRRLRCCPSMTSYLRSFHTAIRALLSTRGTETVDGAVGVKSSTAFG
jgi:hypothetical protein